MTAIAMSHSRINSCGAYASQGINFSGDYLQMAWIYTKSVPAKMINDHIFWNRTICELIRNAMSINIAAMYSYTAIVIISSFLSSGPYPTCFSLFYFRPKTDFKRDAYLHTMVSNNKQRICKLC
jgi:hypothetical protein